MGYHASAESPAEQYILTSILTFLATLLVGLRLYAIITRKIGFGYDDGWIVFALIATWATSITNIVGTAIGNEARHMQLTPDGKPVNLPQYQKFLHTLFVNQLTQVLAVGPTKISVLLFYRRIFISGVFRGWTVINVVTWTLVVSAGLWTIAFFLGNLLSCLPIPVNWVIGSGINGRCADVIAIYLAQAWTDVFLDLFILLVPIPCVWKLRTSVTRRFAIMGIFLVGILTIAASATKLAIQMYIGPNLSNEPDITYELAPIMYWPMIEACLGICAACLPRMGAFRSSDLRGGSSSSRWTISRTSLSPLRLFKSRSQNPSHNSRSEERAVSMPSQTSEGKDSASIVELSIIEEGLEPVKYTESESSSSQRV